MHHFLTCLWHCRRRLARLQCCRRTKPSSSTDGRPYSRTRCGETLHRPRGSSDATRETFPDSIESTSSNSFVAWGTYGVVDCQSLIDVGSHKIIISRTDAGDLVHGSQRRLCLEAQDSICVRYPFLCRQRSPRSVSIRSKWKVRLSIPLFSDGHVRGRACC